MRRISISRALISISLMGSLVFLTGCLVSASSDQRRSGNYVSDETLKQIEPGMTTVGWIRATLGEPTKVDKLEDGTELWKYSYTEHKNSSGAVFLLFAGSDKQEKNGTVFVQTKNGVVTKTWRG
ncbi:MAG TPA: outer membrane protein assembly factor BamE [Humisphaera sp.]|jgi:outer membrane protein assembly factor BamE (lipoprotein component of BamABCDE complex)|nr:outer membrane protein assembly factor BamE [Humisphaera sp.]